MIIKIKRILARLGIGDPLNKLIYTNSEIKREKENHTLINKIPEIKLGERYITKKGFCGNLLSVEKGVAKLRMPLDFIEFHQLEDIYLDEIDEIKKTPKPSKVIIENMWAVRVGKITTKLRFKDPENALRWAKWNYKGHLDNIEIIKV